MHIKSDINLKKGDYAPNIGAPKYIKQMLKVLKGERDGNTMLVGDFNITLTSVDRSCRQKINMETSALSDTLYQMNLTDIHRTFYTKATEYGDWFKMGE